MKDKIGYSNYYEVMDNACDDCIFCGKICRKYGYGEWHMTYYCTWANQVLNEVVTECDKKQKEEKP